jgi:hypothetical protein
MIYTEERWERYNINVEKETVPIANADGSPRLNDDGTPVTAERFVIVAVHPETRRAIRLALGEDARHRIAAELTAEPGPKEQAADIVVPKLHLPFGRGV